MNNIKITLNKIIATLIIIIGCIMIGYGTYSMLFMTPTMFYKAQDEIIINSNNLKNLKKSDTVQLITDLRILSSVSKEEKEKISNYLTSKYNKNFNIIEHTTSFCINQNTENTSYEVDMECNNNDIVNDIYKVSDSNSITFYVKKVTLKDGVSLHNDIKEFQSSGFYDNYVVYYMANIIEGTMKEKFNFFKEPSSLKIVKGVGIESPNIFKTGNTYVGYYFYDRMGKTMFNNEDLNLEIGDYLTKANYDTFSKNITVHVKYDYDLNIDNVKDVIKQIVEHDLIKYDYELIGNKVLIEFNDNIFIDYSFKGGLIDIYKYEKSIDEPFPNKVYDNTIVVNNSTNSDGISYDDFIKLEELTFNY